MPRGNVIVRITGDASGLSAATGRADRDLKRLGATATKQSTAMSQLTGAVKASAAAIGVTGLGAALVGTAKATIDFDKAMRNVNSIAQLNEREFERLRKQVLALAGPTAQAPQTLAEGLYELVSSGFDARESLMVLEASAKAATAGLTTTEVSAGVVTSALKAYQRPAGDAAKVSDILFRPVDRGRLSFEDLAQSLGPILPAAQTAGVSLEEVGAAMATLTIRGFPAAEAATAINGAIRQLSKPTTDLKEAFRQLGVESGEQLIAKYGSLQAALEALRGTTDGTGTAFRRLFSEERGARAALGLTGDAATSAAKDLRGLNDSSGATAKALSQQAKSVAYEWERLKAQISAVAITVGDALIPVVRRVITILVAWNRILLTIPKLWIDVGKTAVDVAKRIVSGVKDAFETVKRLTGNVVAFMLNRFADFLDVASKIPIVGDKFQGLADDVRDAANRVDQLGENIRKVPKELTVDVALRAVQRGDFKPLQDPADLFGPSGGPSLTRGLREQARRRGAEERAKDPFGLGPLGALVPGKGITSVVPLAQRFGLGVSSFIRPGDPGFHGRGRAMDFSGSARGMLAFAQFMASRFGRRLLELIHTPLGFGIDNYARVPLSYWGSETNADHRDHVHVAMARGGMTRRKVRALVGEEGPEIVDLPEGAMVHPFSRSKRMVAAMRDRIARFQSGGAVTAAKAAFAAGFRGDTLVRMVAEAGGESTYNPRAVGDGGASKGLWQIHLPSHPWAWALNLFNPFVNARAAKRIFDSQGIGAWHADHTPYIGEARAAVAALGRGPKGRGQRPGADDPGIDWKRRGGKVGDKTSLPDGTHFFEDGSGWRVRNGRIVARTGASREGRERFADRPMRGPRTSYESRLAGADLAIESADTIQEEKAALGGKQILLGQRAKAIRARLRKINRALKGKLRPSTRRRLLAEQASLLQELGSVKGESRGIGEQLVDLATPGDGEDPNQPLIDAINAKAEQDRQLAEEQRRATEAHTEAVNQHTAEVKHLRDLAMQQGPTLASALAMFGSGLVGNRAASGRGFPSYAGLGGLART